MNLYDIQTSVHVGKDKRNDFGKYNYRTAEGILSALKAALPEGATIIVSDTLQEVAGKIFVTSTATIKLGTGEEYSAQGHAMHALTKKGMDESQITGSTSSYARKYALCGLLAIDDGSADPDAADNRQQAPKQEPKPPMTDEAKRDAMKAAINKTTNAEALDVMWKSDRVTAGIGSLPVEMQGELAVAYTDRMAEVAE
jgi:cell pole-organizing protein PopZ